MQFSFRHAALIASVLLGVLATVSLTLYLNGGDKGKPPGDAQSQPHEEELENFVQFSPPRTVPDISFDLLLPSGEVEKVGLARFKGSGGGQFLGDMVRTVPSRNAAIRCVAGTLCKRAFARSGGGAGSRIGR